MAETPVATEETAPVDEWIRQLDFRSTAEIRIPERLVDQVIGQDGAVDVIRKAAEQKRHVLLIGDPGTGKSWVIARFPPSRGMISVIPYFDQYHRSATIWSPDSRFVAFTALGADGAPGLYVAQADGNIKPRFLTQGDYAFWSWK